MQQPPNPYPHYPQQQWQQPSQPQPSQQQWQQQPNYTQPQPYFPPPPPSSQQQPDKPPTSRTARSRTWLWVLIALLVGMVIGYAIHVPGAQSTPNSPTTTTTQNISQATNQPTLAPTKAVTPTPTHTLKWVTVQTFSGTGDKKTAIFPVPDDWKILWSCQGFTDGTGLDGALGVNVYDNQNNIIDTLSETCKAGAVPTTGETEEHQAGQVYLDISNAGGPWTIQVQELK